MIVYRYRSFTFCLNDKRIHFLEKLLEFIQTFPKPFFVNNDLILSSHLDLHVRSSYNVLRIWYTIFDSLFVLKSIRFV